MFSGPRIASATAVALGIVFGTTLGAAGGPLKVSERKIVDKEKAYEIEFVYPRTGNAAIDQAINVWATDMARDFASTAAEDRTPRGNAYSGRDQL